MAAAQESQERHTNRYRAQAPSYQVGDQVWLSLENIKTNRPSKKLDAKYAKFTVQEVVSSHNYRLDTPPGVNNVFHSRLLRLAKQNPLPGQLLLNNRPPVLLVDGELEYEVDEILDEKKGRGKGSPTLCLVKWTGYADPTWEPEQALQDTLALARWKMKLQAGHQPVGRRKDRNLTRKGRQKKGGGG